MKAVYGLALAIALAAPIGAAEILEQVLVKVNGDIITKTDLEERQIVALRDKMKAPVTAEALKTDEGLKKVLAEITPQLLVDAIDDLLIVQLGKEKGYRMSDDAFKETVERIREQNNLKDEAQFQAALKQEGMTLAELRVQLERSMLKQRVLQDEVGSKLQITEEEARQYYLTNRNEFVQPATVTLREILVEIPTAGAGVNVAQADEAREKIDAIRVRVTTGGEDFGKVAVDVSASASKANGGLIGPLNVSEVSPALQKLLETMKPGDVTEPLRTARGLQLLKVDTLTPSAQQPFDRVRDLVADRVHASRQEVEVRKFLSRVRNQALIEWKNAELKKAYEQQVAAVAPAPGLDH